MKKIITERKDISKSGKKLAILQRENIMHPLMSSIQDFIEIDHSLDIFGDDKKKWYM